MPEQPRLEADGLPSVDFAIRSPNVEETSSDDEGPSHGEARSESLRDDGDGGDGGLGRYIDDIQLTEMDGATPTSPPEKSRGVPGSPSPLEVEGAAGPRAPLHTMPSPVRGRRSLSPQRAEMPVETRPNSYGQGSNDMMDDSIMGASPRTEESMDYLASFFQEGHCHVPMRVPADDELLEEPSRQERDCHSSQDGITRCCQHGVPCTAFYPSPDAPAGPGGVAAAPHTSGRYAHDTTAGLEGPPHPSATEPPAPAADTHELRAGVPRIPAPTAHQPLGELPSTSLSSGHLSPVNLRTYPAPSRAPVFAQPPRTSDGRAPEAPQVSSHGVAYMGDASSQGAAPSETTGAGRPRPFAPPEGLGPDSTTHSGLPSGVPGNGGLPPAGPQSAGPIPAEPEIPSHLRTEGQVFSAVPVQAGQRPQATFGNQMVAGLPAQSWGYAGLPASHGSINQGAFPYSGMQPAYSTGQRIPPFQQDFSGVLPGMHPRTLGYSGAGNALSQGPIAPPMPPPAHGPGMAMPAVPPAAPAPMAPTQVPMPGHASMGVPPQPAFPAGPAHQMGAPPVNATVASEASMPAMPRGMQTMGRMPEEAHEGQGQPTRSASGIPPPPVAEAAPAAAAGAVPASAAVPRVEAALRTEAPLPEQAHSVPPAMPNATPPAGTQCSSQQTEGEVPHVLRDEVAENQHSTPDLSQGQLYPDRGEGAVRDVHEMGDADSADSPRFQAESPLAPSGIPDLDSEQASHQLETPPPTVQRMDQGQQTTPEKPRMPRKKRGQVDPIRLPRDGEIKLVQVDMDQVRSCNQAEGRPKRKQMRVLKSWQNERVVYERVPGSACPTVCKVLVAQPLKEDQKAIPLELNLASPLKDSEGKAWSPLPSNNSDCSYLFGQSEEEKASTFETEEEQPMDLHRESEEQGSKRAKVAKSNRARSSRLRRVEMAAEVGTAAAAAAFEATPPRVRPSHTANGFVRVPIAEGSTEACEIRVGLDNGNWMNCDINIPPRSFNTPEQLAENRSLVVYVMHCQDGTFDAQVDEEVVTLATGSSMVIRSGQEYCLRNGSDQVVAQLKMTLINSSRS